jgi:hypothetical protein
MASESNRSYNTRTKLKKIDMVLKGQNLQEEFDALCLL